MDSSQLPPATTQSARIFSVRRFPSRVFRETSWRNHCFYLTYFYALWQLCEGELVTSMDVWVSQRYVANGSSPETVAPLLREIYTGINSYLLSKTLGHSGPLPTVFNFLSMWVRKQNTLLRSFLEQQQLSYVGLTLHGLNADDSFRWALLQPQLSLEEQKLIKERLIEEADDDDDWEGKSEGVPRKFQDVVDLFQFIDPNILPPYRPRNRLGHEGQLAKVMMLLQDVARANQLPAAAPSTPTADQQILSPSHYQSKASKPAKQSRFSRSGEPSSNRSASSASSQPSSSRPISSNEPPSEPAAGRRSSVRRDRRQATQPALSSTPIASRTRSRMHDESLYTLGATCDTCGLKNHTAAQCQKAPKRRPLSTPHAPTTSVSTIFIAAIDADNVIVPGATVPLSSVEAKSRSNMASMLLESLDQHGLHPKQIKVLCDTGCSFFGMIDEKFAQRYPVAKCPPSKLSTPNGQSPLLRQWRQFHFCLRGVSSLSLSWNAATCLRNRSSCLEIGYAPSASVLTSHSTLWRQPWADFTPPCSNRIPASFNALLILNRRLHE